jgi:hypothetical protein
MADRLSRLLAAVGATWVTSSLEGCTPIDVDECGKVQLGPPIPTLWSDGCAPPSTMIGVTRLSFPTSWSKSI